MVKKLARKKHSKPRRVLTRKIKLLLAGGGALLLVAFFFSPIFSGKVAISTIIPFSTQTVQDGTFELGNHKIKQAGTNGLSVATYSEPKSLFNFIFGGGVSGGEKEQSQTITKQPTYKVIASGTLKYQYMYCSNGSYRYYTDAQFKSPTTGFTHKSPDYCAQNKQGTETQLASVPPNKKTSITPTSFSIPSCTTTPIPYGVDYESVSWLPAGQTQTYSGFNGTYYSCLGTSVQPINEIVYTGTGADYNALAQQEAADQAREKCTAQYNSAKAQINAAGAGGSSAMQELQELYQQCLSEAN